MPHEPGEELRGKLKAKTAVCGVVGLGYVGLPLAMHVCDAGFPVLGFDVDASKCQRILQGDSYVKQVRNEWLKSATGDGRFSCTSDFSRLGEADCISICVPTPLDSHREPDLQFVEARARAIAKRLRPGQLIILESTTHPGTTMELLQPIIEEGGHKVGKDVFLVFSPEREDPGNTDFPIARIPKVVGGVTEDCASIASDYYGAVFDSIVRVSTPAVAEMTKLIENIFRSVNIALVNELKMLCHRMDIDIWEVIGAAATKPFGFMPFYPGPGLGGTASLLIRSILHGSPASSILRRGLSNWPEKSIRSCRTTSCGGLWMHSTNIGRRSMAPGC